MRLVLEETADRKVHRDLRDLAVIADLGALPEVQGHKVLRVLKGLLVRQVHQDHVV